MLKSTELGPVAANLDRFLAIVGATAVTPTRMLVHPEVAAVIKAMKAEWDSFPPWKQAMLTRRAVRQTRYNRMMRRRRKVDCMCRQCRCDRGEK